MMRYKLKCKCGATCWVPGEYDPETNATELNDKVAWEWDCGGCNGKGCEQCGDTGYAKGCDHGDFEIVDEQDDYDPDLEAYLDSNHAP